MESKTHLYPNTDISVRLRSCKEEIIIPIHGKISGIIPQWIRGDLIRNGPGSFEVGNDTFEHIFDGSALLHRFSIENGDVTYQCRFLKSDTYKKNKLANRIVVTEFGTKAVPDPCQTIFQRVGAVFNFKNTISDNSLISVYPFGDELYAFSETPVIHRVNKETLDTEKKMDVSDYVTIVNHTAHPHVEHGNVYNLGMSPTVTGMQHHIVCFPAKSDSDASQNSMFDEAHIVATIPARWPLHPSYMHTFGVTENYFVIVEQPLILSVPKLMVSRLGIINKPLAGFLQWRNDELILINLVSRKTGQLKCRYYSKTFCYMHLINQYEISDHVVLDICSYEDASLLDHLYIQNMKNFQQNPDYASMFKSTSIRFVLPLKIPQKTDEKENLVKLPNTQAKASLESDGRVFVEWEKLCTLGCELPRINYDKHLGKPYRFFYAISADFESTIIKVDTHNKTAMTWREENCYPSESIFVPKPNSEDEDDGVVLSAMVWGGDNENRIGLIILDAKTMLEIGRAEFKTPSPAPKCLHGWFLSK